MQRIQQLEIWREAMDLVDQVYAISRVWPKDELYGLVSQARRAAVSIPANLAEGVGRGGNAELARYARIAIGSAYELETLLMISQRQHYSTEVELVPIFESLSRLIKRTIAFMNKVAIPSSTQE
jgi:four helix bundle protein